MDRDAIRSWLSVMDRLSYYELLGVEPHAGADQIRKAFYGFAATFHPDGHLLRPADEREAIVTIFKRGTEAYRVLSDGALRMRYDEARAGKDAPTRMTSTTERAGGAQGIRTGAPPPSLSRPPAAAGSSPAAAIQGRLEDFVRQSRARPFAQQAEALAKKKEFGKAKLQLKLAISMDPNNPALESYMKELDQKIAEGKMRPPQ